MTRKRHPDKSWREAPSSGARVESLSTLLITQPPPTDTGCAACIDVLTVHYLTKTGVDHVGLERDRVGEPWRAIAGRADQAGRLREETP